MKTVRLLSFVACVSFVVGFWAACSIGFDPGSDEVRFSCTKDQDCLNTHACIAGVCQRRGGTVLCTDDDGDGYGVGETKDCPQCQSADKCAEDCVDNDEAINPGLLDTCDGKDNNCDGEIDEAIPCEASFDCPDETPYFRDCREGACVYLPPVQSTPPCREVVPCVGGARQMPGDECF